MIQTRKIVLIIGPTLCLAGIIAHVWIGGRDDVTGWLALLNNIFPLTLALTIAIVLTCADHAVSRLFRIEFSNGAGEIAFSLFLALGVVGLSMLGLALVGLLRPRRV